MNHLIEGAVKFYGERFEDVMADYFYDHFAYSSPTAFCIAKVEDDHWWIEYAAGNMEELITKLPFWMPQIRFNRRGRPRSYWMTTLVNKLLQSPNCNAKACGNDSVEDGFTDPVPRWRRQWWENQTASSAITHKCG